jgi:hypothetical protein
MSINHKVDFYKHTAGVGVESSKVEVGFDHESFDLISLWLANPTRRKEEGYVFDSPPFAEGLSAVEVKAFLIKMQLALTDKYIIQSHLNIYWSHPIILMTLDEVFIHKVYKRLADRLVLWDALMYTEYHDVMMQIHRLFDQMAYVICGIDAPLTSEGPINVAQLVRGKAYTLLQDIWKYL